MFASNVLIAQSIENGWIGAHLEIHSSTAKLIINPHYTLRLTAQNQNQNPIKKGYHHEINFDHRMLKRHWP